jgi:parallel beta-helix repeat protein
MLALVAGLAKLQAQTDITIGTGTAGNANTTYPCPLQDWYEGSRMQYLYRASELTAAGMAPGYISGLKFNVISLTTSTGPTAMENMKISIGTTTATALNPATWETVSQVFGGPAGVNYTATVGLNNFLFSTPPFFWNGTDNIVVEVCNGDPANTTYISYTGNPVVAWTTGLSFVASHTYREDNVGNACGTALVDPPGFSDDPNARPNIVFTWTPATACSGAPTPGTTVATPATVCLGQTFNLTVSGSTVASGLTYQWQSASSSSGPWTDITGANTSVLSTTQSVTSWYRRTITCSGNSAQSAPVQVQSPTLVAGTFTVGGVGANFPTLNDAYNYIKCGISGAVVFNVNPAAGPYNEQLIMTPVPGASATSTVTWNGTGSTIAFTSTNSSERAVIKLNGADHIIFNNFVIAPGGSTTTNYGYGVQLLNDADSNVVNNCTINLNITSTSTQYAGIVMNASASAATTTGTTLCDYNVFSNNTINGGYYGITMVGSTTDAVGNNKVINNNIRDFYLYGIYISGNFNSLIDSNVISRPNRLAANISDFYGIYSTALSTKVTISRNTFTNPFGAAPASTNTFYGIYFTATDALGLLENKVVNNLIWGLTGSGNVYGIYNSSSDNVFYYHNTIVMDGTPATSAASNITRGFFQTGAAAGIEFMNNIVAISRAGNSTKHAIYFATTASQIISDKNDFYISSGTGLNYVGSFGTTNALTLADWQAASTQDLTSITANPVFTDPTAGNFKPTSPALNNVATPGLGVVNDIVGVLRDALPDIGAWEFEPLPCSVPPTPGTATVSVTPVCVNTGISLSLTGNSIGLTQTYHWQSSTTAGGTFTDIGNTLSLPDTTFAASATLYYRAAVTCGVSTTYSAPVLVTVNPALPAGTYTIGTGGDYPTFNAAKAAMACGIGGPIVFNLLSAPAVYNEQLILDPIANTSAVNTITFNGNGKTLTYLSTNTNERATLKFAGADFVTFNNLTITAQGAATATDYGWGVQFINNSDSNTLNGCTINVAANSTSTVFAGIVMSNSATAATTTGNTNCDGNTINNCTINGGYYGITLVGADATPVRNNKVTNNTLRNFYLYGIYTNANVNTLIDKNDISRPNNTAVTTFYGIYNTGTSLGMRISRNRIHNNSDGATTSTSGFYGIYLTSVDAVAGQENVISNNAIYNVNSEGDVYGLYNFSSDYALYYHNTIALDNTSSAHTTTWWTRAFYQTGAAVGLKFQNNIITIRRTGEGDRHGIYMAEPTTQITSNNNDIYVVKTGTGVAAVGYFSGDRVTLANWQAASGQDAASFSLDPLYTAPGATPADFTPRMPPLDNKGTPVGVTIDINGAARSALTPDLGAFEFTIPPCSAPPTPGTASVFPNTGICMGTMIQLSVSGHSTGAGQTFQWQTSPSNAAGATWTNLGDPMMFPDTSVLATSTLYYRVALTCSGQTSYSVPQLVTLNPAFLAGVYTIGGTSPNFPNFTSAVAALECGVTGPVTFMVRQGVYNEQIRMHAVAGTGPNVQVTFMAENGIPASVVLTYNSTVAANNYTLKLDSASYITYKTMTIAATNTTNGRAIEIANSAQGDSLYNLRINLPSTTSTGTGIIGIYTNLLRGGNHLIKSNTISNGTYGIYTLGTTTAATTRRNLIDSNVINNAYSYGIYAGNQWDLRATNNTISNAAPIAPTNYGMYLTNVDSLYRVSNNKITVSGATAYGMYLTLCDGVFSDSARVTSNTIAINATATAYGMYQATSNNNFTLNNVITVTTTGTASYGLYSTGGANNRYWNNTVNNYTATSTATTSDAAYFSNSAAPVDIRNNVFAHQGVGRALEVVNLNGIYSDYNMLYTAGTTLVRQGTTNYNTLSAWANGAYWDVNSIVYKPAFVSNTDLHPDLTAPEVWAMHGRGVQIPGNSTDFSGNARPTTLTTGVPDLGAYEFLPTSTPLALTGTPAAPAAGTTQTFMFGTDTVAKITYAPGSTVPTTAVVRRYSGVLPVGVNQTTDRSMYFYNKIDITGSQPSNYQMKEFYIDPWLGFIPSESYARLGRTDATNNWITELRSSVDETANVITRDSLNYMDRFTGLTNGQVTLPIPPTYFTQVDSSNRGKRFWVAYQRSYDFFAGSNAQNMVLYLSTDNQPATVTVKVKGTNWVRTYNIPANTAISSDVIPKSGLIDARLLQEGFYGKGISIEADVPITAYAHIYSNSNSGATMLLPVGTYGFEYYTLNSRQNYTTTDAYSSFYVIADRDNTKVQITPSNPTLGGRAAGVPFEVVLNAGDVYQVLGAMISGSEGYDLTGSTVRSIPNSDGKCWPTAVFAGSTRTGLGCGATIGGSGDVIMQQVFPYQAWGTRYLTAPTSNGSAANSLMTNMYRIMVKDTATNVTVNGTTLAHSSLISNRYYALESNTGDVITSNKPIMVAQYISSSGSCPNNTGDGDPEMFYLSPVQQAVKGAAFYRNSLSFINENYLTMVIPTGGLASLTLDGVSHSVAGTFDYTYPHPNMPGYSVVVKRWGAGNGQNVVKSDSAFTGIVYGLGSVESYGYNVGTLVKNLNGIPAISNTLSANPGPSAYTCAHAPFQFRIQVPMKPTMINWQFSAVPVLSPNTNVIQNNPVPVDSAMINGQMYYTYTVTTNYSVSTPGTYLVPISFTHPEIEGCNSTLETTYPLTVLATPAVDFTTASYTVCPNVPVTFAGTGTTVNGTAINTWSYNINTTPAFTANTQNTTTTFTTVGTYDVNFKAVSVDGCLADVTKQVTVAPRPTVAVVADTVGVCAGSSVIFNVQGPVTGVTYNWYNAATGGVLLSSGTSFTAPATPGTVNYFVEASNGSCTSSQRKMVTAIISTVPTVTLVSDSVAVCQGSLSTFTITSPVAGVTYNWYTAPTGGTPTASGTTFTAPSVAGSQYFYVSAANAGCVSPRQRVTAYQTVIPAFTLVRDTIGVCQGTAAVFTVSNPASGVTYNWYTAATGGTAIANGVNFTAPVAPGTVNYYVDASINGCSSSPRKLIVARLSVPLATPVAVADSITQNSIRFKWSAVPGATAYEVSTNGGTSWTAPSSGSLGLTHTVANLTPTQTVTLLVRAIGTNACELSLNGTVTATTQVGTWYIPTAFSPGTIANGPAENDQLRIYPNQNTGISKLQFMVFNQWGQKIGESTDPRLLWDGNYKGKAQPSGVYMYVCHIVMQDGRVFDLKGSVNLIR